MAQSSRIFITLDDDTYNSFEKGREDLGMSRPQFIKYLLNKGKDIRPFPIRFKSLISKVSELDMLIKVLVLKDDFSTEDSLLVMSKLDEIKEMLVQKTSGPTGQK